MNKLAGTRINGVDEAALRDQDTAVGTVLRFPVVGTALPGDPAELAPATTAGGGEFVDPDFFAGGSINSNQGALFGSKVGDVVDHDGREGVAGLVSCVITPGDLKLIHVLRVDLLQGGVVGAVGTAEVVMPGGARGLGRGQCGDQGEEQGESHGYFPVFALLFWAAGFIWFQKINVPLASPITTSGVPSLLRSVTTNCEPTPERL